MTNKNSGLTEVSRIRRHHENDKEWIFREGDVRLFKESFLLKKIMCYFQQLLINTQ